MDYTQLTAVHPRRTAPVTMNAKQEQEYYNRAAQSPDLAEKSDALLTRARRLGGALIALTRMMRGNFGHGMTSHKALH